MQCSPWSMFWLTRFYTLNFYQLKLYRRIYRRWSVILLYSWYPNRDSMSMSKRDVHLNFLRTRWIRQRLRCDQLCNRTKNPICQLGVLRLATMQPEFRQKFSIIKNVSLLTSPKIKSLGFHNFIRSLKFFVTYVHVEGKKWVALDNTIHVGIYHLNNNILYICVSLFSIYVFDMVHWCSRHIS